MKCLSNLTCSLVKKNNDIKLIGFTEVTPESLIIEQLSSNTKQRTLATHVLQFVFLGFTGFRFPFAHFASTTASATDMYILLWKAVNMLSMFGFKIEYISTDGGQSNRNLLKLLIPEFNSALPSTCSFNNIYSKVDSKLFFIMDISHVLKKIRNNVLKSCDHKCCTRHIKFGENYIIWDHFRKAYLWDIAHPFPIHHILTHDHIHLTSESKMRNHLAEDVLNAEMLHLMEVYKESLGDGGSELDGTIELLKNTSVLVKNFRDHRPIVDISGDRLKQNRDVLNWFVEWENSIPTQKEKCLISHQTRDDIVCSILGFEELCHYKMKKSHFSIVPGRINSDVIENMFCQQRTLHSGANTNPTYLEYSRNVNSVILGETSISRKSNTGGNGAAIFSAEKPNKKPKVLLILKYFFNIKISIHRHMFPKLGEPSVY